MERFKRGIGIADDPDSVSIQPKYVDSHSVVGLLHILKYNSCFIFEIFCRF